MIFDTYNLNTQASWYTDQPEGKEVNILCLQQLEKNTFFVGMGSILCSGRKGGGRAEDRIGGAEDGIGGAEDGIGGAERWRQERRWSWERGRAEEGRWGSDIKSFVQVG